MFEIVEGSFLLYCEDVAVAVKQVVVEGVNTSVFLYELDYFVLAYHAHDGRALVGSNLMVSVYGTVAWLMVADMVGVVAMRSE